MKMIYDCISLLINLLEGKDYYIDNTNCQRIFVLYYMPKKQLPCKKWQGPESMSF